MEQIRKNPAISPGSVVQLSGIGSNSIWHGLKETSVKNQYKLKRKKNPFRNFSLSGRKDLP
jgi:hypothetical protein